MSAAVQVLRILKTFVDSDKLGKINVDSRTLFVTREPGT